LNKSSESGHSCLVPGLLEIISGFSPFIKVWDVGLSYVTLSVEGYPSMSEFFECYNKRVLNYIRCLSVSFDVHMVCNPSYDELCLSVYIG
jgi:hypothetical protein